jgi:transposase-like protein
MTQAIARDAIYITYRLSYRDLAAMMAERGIDAARAIFPQYRRPATITMAAEGDSRRQRRGSPGSCTCC